MGHVLGSWADDAACHRLTRRERIRLFFPDPYSPEEDEVAPVAKAICAACPVRVECLAAVMTDEDERAEGEPVVYRYGIAGGLLARERDELAAAQQPDPEPEGSP